MITSQQQGKIAEFFQKLEMKLVLFFIYIIGLVYAWFTTGNLKGIIYAHLIFVTIFGFIYFFYEFMMFLFSPIYLVMWPIQNWLVKKYIKRFPQNIPSETVIVFGHSNWLTLEGWVKPIFFRKEIKMLIELLKAEHRSFSFYPTAKIKDVKAIMQNTQIKEVYFYGHGDSHSFQLDTDEILYYCDFNHPKYTKEFVHQIHCGDRFGKSLIDYVVPEENQPQCFFFRKKINAPTICKEFKKRIIATSQKK